MKYIIGIDFDNTIVNHDDMMYELAVQEGLIDPGIEKSKKHIRDGIRQLPDGEVEWQRLQSIVYGQKMEGGRLIEGVRSFFALSKEHKATVYIISHKTEYAKLGDRLTNLRVAALAWMRREGFFQLDEFGLSPDMVYFESTRSEKINRISHLKCTHFIDDLEETFLENSFPATVEKILYAPQLEHESLPGVRVLTTWGDITDYFFGTRS